MTAPFAGSSALVFGGAKGIGQAVVREWARRGARVTIADIDHAMAGETAESIVAEGGQAIAVAADVSSDQSIASAVAAGEAAFGEIDIVMNNVGVVLNGNPEDIPFAEWNRIAQLNYFAPVRTLAILLPKFLARGTGHVVNTASFAGLYPYASTRVPYAATKAAVIAMSEGLALYLEPKGIRVSCLIPGPVATPIMDSMTTWTENLPMRGPGKELTLKMPNEVAVTLSDGMRDGRILIPSDEQVWTILQRWAADPDAFIRGKIAAFESGDLGIPGMPVIPGH